MSRSTALAHSEHVPSLPNPFPGPDARCQLHAERPALEVCHRCGAFVCFDCLRSVTALVHCEACAARPPAPPRGPPVRVWVALALAWAGAIVLPCALGGLGLAWWELRRIEAGRVPMEGHRLARAALVTALWCLPVSSCLGFFWLVRLP
ncbi:hypothetical protein JY651_38960 [Pyxidicoccus parkwayensis]|uniref:B box-type domain-containing protein n=1 Tax=Pyxidicoccus parkwayensis TaxID=2813578 RepID=A0ABX7NRZ9_9BACT|nr:hypothetical protein [Pyxidicoccus parkwaysis]QSQ21129.1 hypothetical protein JY651_38960 [Pyxidicoccus parkwaysis]